VLLAQEPHVLVHHLQDSRQQGQHSRRVSGRLRLPSHLPQGMGSAAEQGMI
jgi:hypothetical protein